MGFLLYSALQFRDLENSWFLFLCHEQVTHVNPYSKLLPGKDAGKSLSEALIFASTKPQYNDRLFIEL